MSMNPRFFIIKKQINHFITRKNAFCNNLTYLQSKTVAFGLVFLRKTLYTVVIGNPGLHLNLSKAFSLWFSPPQAGLANDQNTRIKDYEYEQKKRS